MKCVYYIFVLLVKNIAFVSQKNSFSLFLPIEILYKGDIIEGAIVKNVHVTEIDPAVSILTWISAEGPLVYAGDSVHITGLKSKGRIYIGIRNRKDVKS